MLKTAVAGLSRVANSLAIAANALGTLVVLALVVILNVDVIARGLFSAPLRGTYEMVQFSVVMIVFLQLADVVRVDRLTRSDGFLNLLHHRRPGLTANLRRIINAISAIFMGLIAYVTFPGISSYVGDTGLLRSAGSFHIAMVAGQTGHRVRYCACLRDLPAQGRHGAGPPATCPHP